MEVIRTDEPDIAGGLLEPVYRVHIWSISEDPSVAPNLSAWRIKGAADVHEAIDWANNECGGRRYELFLEWIDHAQSKDRGWVPLVCVSRLAGRNPTENMNTVTLLFTKDD
ncbi:hypothetical protein [Paenarthrobacter ureafaciens]|uniref:hypothetical protein n=1 Tax=Paenarthrobacter ureafaciens TaxID=37931 RepID=UPI0022706650|nr:hypothetical protein [Paenarthrobacter ureafaciens]MCY0975556.1 hypothetical protein [Paenarthrobacter ureafaciens]